MEINELIVGGIGLLTTVTSGWASWFFTRKKYDAEVDSNYIENLSKALETYDTIILHNRSEIEYLMKENEDLKKEVSELRSQVFELTKNLCIDLTNTEYGKERLRKIKSDSKKNKNIESNG